MRHQVEVFDTEALQLMASAIEAAVQTMRLTGAQTDHAGRLAMGRSVMVAASQGERTAMHLTEVALSERFATLRGAQSGSS